MLFCDTLDTPPDNILVQATIRSFYERPDCWVSWGWGEGGFKKLHRWVIS
jgi:hypothetical protein